MRGVVVALGDLGRIASKQYHSHALSALGIDLDLVGFGRTALARLIGEDRTITIHRLSTSNLRHGVPGLGYAPLAVIDSLRIGLRRRRALKNLEKPDFVLVQDPPAFPTLTVVRRALVKKGVRFVIDWHNIGYTVL